MATSVIPFDRGQPATVFTGRQSSISANARSGVQESFAVVSIKGKIWQIRHRGETQIVRDEATGMPEQLLQVVIVGASPNISKDWYESGWQDDSRNSPDCFSTNGQVPDPSSPKRQNAICATCPRNQWPRAGAEGARGKECRDRKLLAVVPAGDIENEFYEGPMLLRLPPTSLKPLARYTALLEQKGAGLEQVVTGMYFDPSVPYPKIEFKAVGWLQQAQAVQVVGEDGQSGVISDPKIARMLNAVYDGAAAIYEPDELTALDVGGPPPAFQNRVAAPEPEPKPKPVPAPAPLRVMAEVAPANPEPAPVVREAPVDMLSEIDELLSRPA